MNRRIILSHWPPPRVAFRVAGIAAFIWLACRASGWAVTRVVASSGASPFMAPLPFGPPLMVILVVALVRLQLGRSNELVLYQNLGVRPAYLLVVAVVTAVMLETALWTFLIEADLWSPPPREP